MKKRFLFLFSILLFIACDEVKHRTKETINKGGETVGKTATEFFEGVSEGIDKTLQCKLTLSQKLLDKGVKTGKFSISDDKESGKHNLLTIYLIFEQDLNTTLTAMVTDKDGLEYGRSRISVNGKAGDAAFYDFVFDPRTYIEVRSNISIE